MSQGESDKEGRVNRLCWESWCEGERAWGRYDQRTVSGPLCARRAEMGLEQRGLCWLVSELPHWSPPQLCEAHEPCFSKENILRDPGGDAQRHGQERPKEALVTSALLLCFLLGPGWRAGSSLCQDSNSWGPLGHQGGPWRKWAVPKSGGRRQ